MGSGKISRLKFHYMDGGDLIQFCEGERYVERRF